MKKCIKCETELTDEDIISRDIDITIYKCSKCGEEQ